MLIPIHINGSGVDITLSAFSGDTPINILDYNTNSQPTSSLTLTGNQSYYIKVDVRNGVKNVSLKFEWYAHSDLNENISIILDDITVIDGLNKELKPEKIQVKDQEDVDTLQAVLTRINAIISGSDKPTAKFYYTYRGDNSILMNNVNFEDANAMWDVNNVANMMTLPQIKIADSNIKVVNSMRRD